MRQLSMFSEENTETNVGVIEPVVESHIIGKARDVYSGPAKDQVFIQVDRDGTYLSEYITVGDITAYKYGAKYVELLSTAVSLDYMETYDMRDVTDLVNSSFVEA